MRRTIILLVLAMNGGLLTACGGGAHAARSAHAAALARTGVTASGPVTKPQALAFARAVNLTAADVPGFSGSAKHERETTGEKRLEREVLRCAGPARAAGFAKKGLAELSSKDFELKHGILELGVSSGVGVAETSALAARELAAIGSAHVRGCFSHYLDQLFKGQQFGGAAVGPVSIQSGTPPAPGTSGSFGWRVKATITVRQIRVSFYIDILGFFYGPARVTLFSYGALRPFPAAIQQQLFSLLLARAKAHRL
jgi:hypothetical protein